MKRLFLLFLIGLGLAGCGRRNMPDWLPEALGGPVHHDRFFDGPLQRPIIENGARHGLPPLESLRPDGIRISIAPSFGDRAFIVDFVPQPRNCYLPDDNDFDETRSHESCAYIRADYSIIDERAPAQRHSFIIPQGEFRAAVTEFNRLGKRCHGSAAHWTDGTSVGIEQYRGGRLRSIDSNAPYPDRRGNPVAAFAHQVHHLLLAFAPTGTVPRNSDFTIETASDYPCQPTSFNEADADGFGVGGDPCARFLAERSSGPDRPNRAVRNAVPAGTADSVE